MKIHAKTITRDQFKEKLAKLIESYPVDRRIIENDFNSVLRKVKPQTEEERIREVRLFTNNF